MADESFAHPRLAAIYDPLDPDRSDLDAYLEITQELQAHSVLDIGCGTGAFALLLVDREIEVTGIDPAGASIDAARAKAGRERVRWICGDATDLPPLQVDLATMTANVAQEIVDPRTWQKTLRTAHDALRPGGHLVFETRSPARRAWEEWTREDSHSVTEFAGYRAQDESEGEGNGQQPAAKARGAARRGSDYGRRRRAGAGDVDRAGPCRRAGVRGRARRGRSSDRGAHGGGGRAGAGLRFRGCAAAAPGGAPHPGGPAAAGPVVLEPPLKGSLSAAMASGHDRR
ncbi:class I SAM-dependent methyltransferase [Streptomyces sp. NBC_01198]|uniref:class I SAM-dependent methyltransferase n=1 Tax=Streptomyces sp. NBC_01198 TaxID=2903769 RepID=UPI002E0E338D|nr:class I SAM-dependent methyltransferase [Streptomyces sp. NBC_01198]